ncbi:MAG: BTAD domain-containing putative transcriptional regulator [Desulfobacteraceae bacterium]|jgi:ATP/maltotriose-dependent transcriptional regulator MalT/DNA-binding SARP family transcriptional activator
MMTPVIKAKLNPAVSGHLVFRERLIEDLRENTSKRLFLVVSYSGGGKTTLAAQFLQSQKLPYVWYNLDTYDQDPTVFFQYLITALQKQCPQFCIEHEPHSFSSADSWPLFVQELEKIDTPSFFIVLDNYECILGAKPINHFLAYLLKQLPSIFHLMILTNRAPRFSMNGCRLADDLHQLKGSDLAFTSEEAQCLLNDIFELSVPESTVKQLLRETEGWALALVLFAQSLRVREHSPQDEALDFTNGCKENLHAYFMEEVFSGHPRKIQDLLTYSAFLPSLSLSELKDFLGSEDAELLFRSILEQNIPIVPLDGTAGTYRYHRLFSDFLLQKARDQKSSAEIAKRHLQTAIFLEKCHPVEAIDHYLRASHPEKAVALLEDLGLSLLREGRFEMLKLLLNKIPSEMRSQRPVLLYYAGRIREIRGDMEDAKNYYHKAQFGLKDRSNDVRAACLGRLGIMELKKDRFKEARKIFNHSLHELESRGIHREVTKRLIATHANLAKVHCKLEEYEKAASHLKQTRSLFDLYGETGDEVPLLQAQALQGVLEGRFQDVLPLGGKGKSLCQKLGFEAVIPVFDHYCAFANLYMGNFGEAQRLAEKGLSILENQGTEDCLFGALLADLGHCQLATGHIHEGVKSLAESSRLFKKSHNFCGQYWNDFSISLLATRQGDLSMAWDHWRMMERNCGQLSLPIQKAMTLTVDAHLSALEQSPDKTMEKLAQAMPFFMQSQQKMSVFQGLVLGAKSYLTIDRNDLAEEAFLKAISLGDLNQYYYCFHYELDWFRPFLERITQKNRHLSSLWVGFPHIPQKEASFASEGSKPHLSVTPLTGDGLLDLRIYALGPFRVMANGWNVPLDQCPSKKAITLLKYLFFKRHERGIFLDEALEFLWPEMDPQMTRANLRVILSMLRKVFKRPETGGNGFPNLVRDGNRLSLELGKGGWTDVDEFLNQITLADYKEKMNLWPEALGHYEKIIDLYDGDFLCEELYSDWCYMEREYLRDQFLASLMRTAECYVRLAKTSEAISTLYHLLRIDRFREDAYRKLMMLCANAGRKGDVIKAYNMCKRAIEEDLNLKLSSDTEDLYAKISSPFERDFTFLPQERNSEPKRMWQKSSR